MEEIEDMNWLIPNVFESRATLRKIVMGLTFFVICQMVMRALEEFCNHSKLSVNIALKLRLCL